MRQFVCVFGEAFFVFIKRFHCIEIGFYWISTSVIETGIFPENQVNIMAADALAMSSTAVALNV